MGIATMKNTMTRILSGICMVFLFAGNILAYTDGEWNKNGDGNWSDTANWKNSDVADGAGATADISKTDISVNRTINLDASYTIGHLLLADAGEGDGSNTRGWTITNTSSVLTLSTGGSGTPSIGFGAKSSNAGNAVYLDVKLAGTEGVEFYKINGYPRPVSLRTANSFSGTTTIKNGGWIRLSNNDALGSSAVVIENGGRVAISSYNTVINPTISNQITLQGGTLFAEDLNNTSGRICTFNGTLLLDGVGYINNGDRSNLIIDTPITEATAASAVEFSSDVFNSNRAAVRLLKAGSYTGTTLVKQGARIYVLNANAFGTTTNTVVVQGTGDEDRYLGILHLENSTGLNPTGLNANKTIEVGRFGNLAFNRGITNSNNITVKGGFITFGGAGKGARELTGTITLEGGVTSRIDRVGGTYDSCVQSGEITGSGMLYVYGGDGNSLTIYFNGDNSYSGGTRFTHGTISPIDRLGHNNAFGTGPIWVNEAVDTRESFRISKDLEMANAFRGRGRIGTTASFTLTMTGSVAPYDEGLDTVTKKVGTFEVEKLCFGSNAKGATYIWQYDDTTNDVVNVVTKLTFGNAKKTVDAEWLGSGDAPEGTYTLFKFAGAAPGVDPDEWEVNAPHGLKGSVQLDGTLVQLKLAEAEPIGTILMIK